MQQQCLKRIKRVRHDDKPIPFRQFIKRKRYIMKRPYTISIQRGMNIRAFRLTNKKIKK